MKVPEDRNPCLTVVAVEKKSSLRFTKKGEVLEDTHDIAMEAVRPRSSPSRDRSEKLDIHGQSAMSVLCVKCVSEKASLECSQCGQGQSELGKLYITSCRLLSVFSCAAVNFVCVC